MSRDPACPEYPVVVIAGRTFTDRDLTRDNPKTMQREFLKTDGTVQFTLRADVIKQHASRHAGIVPTWGHYAPEAP